MAKYLLVLTGGGFGALVRFLVATFVADYYTTAFPLGTFFINISGSFLIGVLMMFFVHRTGLDPHWRLFLVTGFLGGYTTFSSFEWEALALVRGRSALISIIYVTGSVVLGYGGVWLGAWLSERWWAH